MAGGTRLGPASFQAAADAPAGAHPEHDGGQARQLLEARTGRGSARSHRLPLSSDPPTLRGPDIGFVRAGRGIDPEARIQGAPDLAVEIVSPNDTASGLLRKVQQYLAAAAHTVRVVYPDNGQVHVSEAGGQTRVLKREGVLTEPDLLPGFSVQVAVLFE